MQTINISRILIVGTGSMGTLHFETAKSLIPHAEIAVYSESGRGSQFPRVLSSKKEIEAFQPEISVIANRASRHIEFSKYLAEMGSHLLIEKPVSHNLEGVHDLVNLQKLKNLKIAVGYNLRYLSSFQAVRAQLQERTFGRILDIRIEVGQSLDKWRPNRDYRGTVSARREDGGGVLRELSHEFDYFLELFGYPQWVISSLGKVSDLNIDVEDVAHLILGMKDENGLDFMATMHMDFIRQDKERSCTVIGTEGTLHWNLLDGRVVIKTSNSAHHEIQTAGRELIADTYTKEWENLIKSINLNVEMNNSLLNSIRVLEVIAACERSSIDNCKFYLVPVVGTNND